MKYTSEQYNTMKKLVESMNLIDNHQKRKEKLGWYDLASGIKNKEVSEQILKDMGAI